MKCKYCKYWKLEDELPGISEFMECRRIDENDHDWWKKWHFRGPDDSCEYGEKGGMTMDAQEFFDKVNKTLEPLKTLKPLQKDPDLVRVVRCRDCRYWEPENTEEGDSYGYCICRFGTCCGHCTDMNWFCADGEREG